MTLRKRVADLEAKAKSAVKCITCWVDLMKAADGDGPTEIAPWLADKWRTIVECLEEPCSERRHEENNEDE